MAGTLAPSPKFYGWNNTTGEPLAGGLLYTVSAGGAFPGDALTTFNDADLDPTHANTNPIVLNSAGYCVIYLIPGLSYKFILKQSNGTLVWTQDDIAATPNSSGSVDVTGVAGEDLGAEDAAYLSDGSGGKDAGKWYHASATNAYSSSEAGTVGIVQADVATDAIGTFRLSGQMDIVGSSLNPGSKYYVSATDGAFTTAVLSNSRYLGEADGINSIILAPNPPQGESLNFVPIAAFGV